MGVETDEIRAQVDRLMRSKTFETSEAHRRLLQYLAEKTLSGEADRLKEYTVGLEAFGKPTTYDPRQDSIVRLQAGRLRQKLAAYYQTEATENDIQVNLPKGGFKLTFEEARRPNGDAHHAEIQPPTRKLWILAGALALAVTWAIAATVWLVQTRRATAGDWSPELEALWSPLLHSHRSLVVCLGTPLFVRFPGYGFFRDPKTNDWEEIRKSDRMQSLIKVLGDKDLSASYAFTGAGEATAAVLLSKLLASRKPDVLLTRSNLLNWQQITDQNVIFLGPPKFNLQLQAAALTQDIAVEPEGIRNLRPQPGEPQFLADHILAGKFSEGETHALISRTPGISGEGEFLMIAGNASPDTLAAAEWLVQPVRAKELVTRLRSRSGTIPKYFQVVIKVAFKQGIPVQSTYVFHHVLGEPAKDAGKQ